jgi:hypothetical protein
MSCSSCIDGRARGAVFGSPGGDAGIVLRVLLAARKVCALDPSAAEVAALVESYSASAGRPLYFHTDSHATHHYDPRAAFTPECTAARSIGCGYFRAGIHSPRALGAAEPEAVSALASVVWTAFCSLAAAGSPAVRCVELTGDHAEDDVVVVERPEPADPAGHCFVYHPLHEQAVAAELVAALRADAKASAEITAALKGICAEHWNGAITLLAPGVAHRHIK